MKKRYIFIMSIMLTAVTAFSTFAGVLSPVQLTPERNYEPVVVLGSQLAEFAGTPIDQLFLFAYHEGSGWEVVPFQVDEYDSSTQNGLLDNSPDEQLVFLAQDIGDKVTLDEWIDDASAQSSIRYELDIVDSLNTESVDNAYVQGSVYLFKSTTLTADDRSPIHYITYDATNDRVEGQYYTMNFADSWYPQDITVTEENGGNGTDFFERFKARFFVMISGLLPLILEESFLVKQDVMTSPDPVIRLRRRIVMKLVTPDGQEYGEPFTFTYRHYPYFTLFSGKIDPRRDFGEGFPVKAVRMSYDLNESIISQQVKFYSGDSSGITNNGIPVDGQNDAGVNTDMLLNKPNWTMVTAQDGGFGTLLTINDVVFTRDSTVSDPYFQHLYYYDHAQNDSSTYPDFEGDYDTGDFNSYGDHGMYFESYLLWGVFDYKSTSYFLPANTSIQTAQTMFRNFQKPLYCRRSTQSYSVDVAPDVVGNVPTGFQFPQNYPNPFNLSTVIRLSLPQAEHSRLVIYNLNGRIIRTLLNGTLSAGKHTFHWDGKNEQGKTVGSGIYVASFETNTYHATRKLVLAK